MSYTPTNAECRLAVVRDLKFEDATAQYTNADGANNVNCGYGYTIAADLTTALTGGAIKGKCLNYVSFIDPLSANFTANIGDTCDVLSVDSSISTSAPYDASKWIYGIDGWRKFLTGGNSLTANLATAAETANFMWSTNSATTGTIRQLSVRQQLTGTGTQDGEAIRSYNLITGTIAGSSVHGTHSTLQLGSETVASTGACTGSAAGVRATIGIGLTNTAANLGTIAALRADTYFQSTAATAASSYIYACDVSTYGVDAILRLGTVVSRTTSKSTMTAAYAYVSGGMTIGAATAALKVVTPDGSFYIPLLPAANLT